MSSEALGVFVDLALLVGALLFVGVFLVGVTWPSSLVDVLRALVDLRTGAESLFKRVAKRNTSWTIIPRPKTPIATTAVTVPGSDMSSLSSCMAAAWEGRGRRRVWEVSEERRSVGRNESECIRAVEPTRSISHRNVGTFRRRAGWGRTGQAMHTK